MNDKISIQTHRRRPAAQLIAGAVLLFILLDRMLAELPLILTHD